MAAGAGTTSPVDHRAGGHDGTRRLRKVLGLHLVPTRGTTLRHDERSPREATIQPASHGLSAEMRIALRGLIKHCSADKARPALHYAARHQYDGRSWLVATDTYRALLVREGWDGLTLDGLDDGGLDGIHVKDLRAAVKGRQYDGGVTVPISAIDYGAPNVVDCIPAPSAAVTVERQDRSSGELFTVAGDGAGYVRSTWRIVGGDDIAPERALAIRVEHLDDAAKALNTSRLIVGYAPDRPNHPFLIRPAHQHVTTVDGFVISMPVRID